MEPTIIFQDNDLIVLNKPSGITVNKADTTRYEKTIQEWLEDNKEIKFLTEKVDKNEDFIKRSGIVHRLDKETSGILLVAKNLPSFKILQQQFKDRVVKKTYIALVHGRLLPKDGDITVPLGRLPWNRKRFGMLPGGREAVTIYKTVGNYTLKNKKKESLSLLMLNPKTGRTHQIRVHMKYIFHPIFSDLLYAGRKTAKEDRKLLSRLFLHASEIIFYHPVTKELLSFKSKLPNQLEEFLFEYTTLES